MPTEFSIGSSHAPEIWRVENRKAKTTLGYSPSFEIATGHNSTSLLGSDDWAQRRAAFSASALWVTAYKPGELYAAGEYPNQSASVEGLPNRQRREHCRPGRRRLVHHGIPPCDAAGRLAGATDGSAQRDTSPPPLLHAKSCAECQARGRALASQGRTALTAPRCCKCQARKARFEVGAGALAGHAPDNVDHPAPRAGIRNSTLPAALLRTGTSASLGRSRLPRHHQRPG